LDLVEDLVIESEVIAGDGVDTSILLDSPMGETESLGLCKKLSLRKLAAPVCLSGLLEVTVDTHARETENRSGVRILVSTLQLWRTSAIGVTYD
jgi:hypothetical protein